ncbi:hypothetical protein [Selenomonas sputigena]|uniref:hypothetical protein n=1 Tax=Selenomonas sputigena TaxID=69823 RepID=UPI002234915E|nr:hypothetical protein OL236_06815 [Selenomonas sputigena]
MAENLKEKGFPQKDSAEHEEYVGASRSFRRIWEERNRVQPELLEKILSRENLNRAFKRVKKNKGAAGVDGMTIEETQAHLKEGNHAKELVVVKRFCNTSVQSTYVEYLASNGVR